MTAKNGRGRYGILDIQGFEKTQTPLRLMNELAKDRKSGEEKGGLTLEAVEKELGIVNGWAFIRRSPKRSFSVREQSKNFFEKNKILCNLLEGLSELLVKGSISPFAVRREANLWKCLENKVFHIKNTCKRHNLLVN